MKLHSMDDLFLAEEEIMLQRAREEMAKEKADPAFNARVLARLAEIESAPDIEPEADDEDDTDDKDDTDE